ncbi:hypothetical protein [Staphylococcus aureus]|uniref:hypothetical protein n=1 Tax=Staphylococcus aureus TaxID=1280 RepID=UPI001CD9D841|nr:hypothetical protein [Staphylococcus aureus]
MCKLAGPQHREFQKEILQTMQVGERGPNTEGDEKSAYNNVQVGGAPTQRISKEILQTMQVGDQRNKFYENIISIPLLRITT